MTAEINKSRRRFIKGIGLGIMTGAAAGLGALTLAQRKEGVQPVQTLSELRQRERIALNPPHKELIKPIINAAYAPYFVFGEKVEDLVRRTRLLGSNTLRVYTSNSFRRRDGEFNMGVLQNLHRFIHDFQMYSEGEMGVIVCLKDYYNLLYRDIVNGLYPAKPLNDPALVGAETPEEVLQRQIDVFTKDMYINRYIEEAQLIINHLKQDDLSVTAWEVANEPDRPDMIPYLENWYSHVAPAIREIDPDTPLISGLKNPLSVDPVQLYSYGVDHTSAHVYGEETQKSLDLYIDNMVELLNSGIQVPSVLLTEVGVHRNFYRIPVPKSIHDIQVAHGLQKTLLDNIRYYTDSGQPILPLFGFGLWQHDYGQESHDGFHVNPDTYPHTMSTMQKINEVYSL